MKTFEINSLFNFMDKYEKYKEDIFECFIEFYGEEHRVYIMDKLTNVNIHYQKIEINSNVQHYNFICNFLENLLEAENLNKFNQLLTQNSYKCINESEVSNYLLYYQNKLILENEKVKIIKKYYNHLLKNTNNENNKNQFQKILSLFILDEDFINLLTATASNEIEEEDIIETLNYYFSDTAYNNSGLILFRENKNDIFLSPTKGIDVEANLIHELNHLFIDGEDYLEEGIIEIINEAISQEILKIMKNKGINLVLTDIANDYNLYRDSIYLVDKLIKNLPSELLVDFKNMVSDDFNNDQLLSNCKEKLGNNLVDNIIELLNKEINIIELLGTKESKVDLTNKENEIILLKEKIDTDFNNIIGDNNERFNTKRNV